MKHRYFTKGELVLWGVSVLAIVLSFLLLDRGNHLTLLASLVGVTSLIFCAKGNPVGQLLMVLFSMVYGYISLTFSYYGEMLTYLCMTMPMAVVSLVVWLKNPYAGNRSQVKVASLSRKQWLWGIVLTLAVTAVFYYVLKAFHTANLSPSTLSVATSFLAVYLTYRRSPYFALAYAANDVVLIILWTLASFRDVSYLSVVICFAAFLVNDIYAYISWRAMEKSQKKDSP